MPERDSGGGRPPEGGETLGSRLKGWDRRPTFGGPSLAVTDRPREEDAGTRLRDQLRGLTPEMIDYIRRLETAGRRQPVGMEQMGRMGGDPPPEIGPDEELFSIYSQDGFRYVAVPRSREGRMQYMRDIMAKVESTSDPNGGLYRIQNQELYYIIDKLIRRREGSVAVVGADGQRPLLKEEAEKDAEDGRRLHDEWQARNAFHGVTLKFHQLADIDKIKDLVETFPAESLNSLFRIKEVIFSIGYLHSKGDEYIKAFSTTLNATPPNPNKPDSWPNGSYAEAIAKYQKEKLSLDEFKLRAQQEIKTRLVAKLGSSATEQQKHEILNQDLGWAVNLGERLFQFGGGMSVYDKLTEPSKDGDPRFLTGGSLNGGLWAYRRTYKSPEFARSYANRRNFQPMIWRGIDLETRTLFDSLSEATGAGFLQLKPKTDGEGFVETDRKFDLDKFENYNWENFDFHSWGASPLWNGWYYMGVHQPESAAAPIRDTNEGAQTLPSVKALEKLRTAFFYKGDGGWADKRQLAKNYLHWAREATDEYGKHMYTFEQLKADIVELVGSHDKNKPAFIRPMDKVDIMAELYNMQGPLRRFLDRKPVRLAGSFLPLWFIELIIRALKAGFSSK